MTEACLYSAIHAGSAVSGRFPTLKLCGISVGGGSVQTPCASRPHGFTAFSKAPPAISSHSCSISMQ